MLELSNKNVQFLTKDGENVDENFFNWLFTYITDVQQQLEKARLSLTEKEYHEMPHSSFPQIAQNVNFAQVEEDDTFEVFPNDDKEMLALKDASTLEMERLLIENNILQNKNNELEGKIVKLQEYETNYHILNNFCNMLGDVLNKPTGHANWGKEVVDHISDMLKQMTNLQLEKMSLNEEIKILQQKMTSFNTQMDASEEKVKNQALIIHDKEQTIIKLLADKKSLESKVANSESELQSIQERYDKKISELRSELLHVKQPIKENFTKKRKADDFKDNISASEFEEQDEISKKLMKQLFIVFYGRYFKILYEHKWVHLGKITSELKAEIQDKLKIFAQIKADTKPSCLLDVLMNYVDYEFRSIFEEGVRKDIGKGVEDITYLEDLIDEAIKKTIFQIEQLWSESCETKQEMDTETIP